MLSETVKSRQNLTLTFTRSISEPGHSAGKLAGMPSLVASPPSMAPNLHPPKRCKLDHSPSTPTAQSQLADFGVSNGENNSTSPVPLRKPTSLLTNGNHLKPTSLNGHSNGVPSNGGGFLLPQLTASVISLPNSPCAESNSMQRNLVISKTGTISTEGLAARLANKATVNGTAALINGKNGKNGGGFLLLDCRPFIAYNVSHILGAINVNCCDRFNRKRLQQGKASLADLATTKEAKEMLKKRTWKEVIVYDECSSDLTSLPSTHTLFLVINSLVEDARSPVVLVGGLQSFQATQPGLCEDHLMRSPPSDRRTLGLPGLPAPPSPSDLSPTKDIENHPASEVTRFLFVGNMKDAGDTEVLKRLGIDHVLNVTSTKPLYKTSQDIVYKQLHVADNGYQNLRQYFEEAFEFIELAKARGGAVLIHCQAGVSRSPTIAVAYLIKNFPMSMIEAYRFVKSRRSIISPNLNFMGQLLEFEQSLIKIKENNSTKAVTSLKNGSSLAAPTVKGSIHHVPGSGSNINSSNGQPSAKKLRENCELDSTLNPSVVVASTQWTECTSSAPGEQVRLGCNL